MTRNLKRVVVIDDDPFMLGMLGEFLELDGYSVALASTAETGLATIKASAPELVVLDWGTDALSVIRAIEQHSPMPAVIVVSGNLPPSRDKAPPRICDWLVKPVASTQLTKACERALSVTRGEGPGVAEAD